MSENQPQWMRLLCKETVDTDTVRKFASQYWFLWNRIERDDNQPLVYEWSTAQQDCRIRYTDDHRLGQRWFELQGPGVQQAAILVKSAFPIYQREEVIALASEAKDENHAIWAAFRLAVWVYGLPFDPDMFGAFGDLANHRSTRARDAAIYAMGQTGWPQFAGILEPMAEDDPDEGVRMRAKMALGALPK